MNALLAAAEPELIRREPVGGAVLSEISAQLGSVSAVFDGGAVKSFSAEGKLFWEFKAGGRLLPFITRSRDAAVYVCRTNGDFFALNRAGMCQWQLSLGEPLSAPALCGWDDRLFLFVGKKVICLTATGQRLWQREFAAPFVFDPQLSAQGGFIGLLQNNVVLNVSAFGVITEIPLINTPALILPVAPASGGGRILVIYGDGRLELYDAQGEARGGLTHLNGAPLAGAAQGATAAVQLASGQLVLLDTDNARILWRSNFQSGVGAAGNRAQKTKIQFNETAVYVLSISGAAGFSKKDGTELWSARLENASVAPAIDDGILYSGGRDWILYLYRVGARSKGPRQISLLPEGRYGLGDPPSAREWSALSAAYLPDFAPFLESFARRIEHGEVGEAEEASARLLLGIASESAAGTAERINAIRLLGMTGSRETIPFLVRRFRQEREPLVQRELALALGRIGCDPQGSVFDNFERIIKLNRPVRQEQLLSAIAAATGNICRFTGPPVSERGIELLVMLASEGSSPAVQQAARREMELLMR